MRGDVLTRPTIPLTEMTGMFRLTRPGYPLSMTMDLEVTEASSRQPGRYQLIG